MQTYLDIFTSYGSTVCSAPVSGMHHCCTSSAPGWPSHNWIGGVSMLPLAVRELRTASSRLSCSWSYSRASCSNSLSLSGLSSCSSLSFCVARSSLFSTERALAPPVGLHKLFPCDQCCCTCYTCTFCLSYMFWPCVRASLICNISCARSSPSSFLSLPCCLYDSLSQQQRQLVTSCLLGLL